MGCKCATRHLPPTRRRVLSEMHLFIYYKIVHDVTDFQYSFAGRFCSKFAVKCLLRIPSHLWSLVCTVQFFWSTLYKTKNAKPDMLTNSGSCLETIDSVLHPQKCIYLFICLFVCLFIYYLFIYYKIVHDVHDRQTYSKNNESRKSSTEHKH